MTIAKSTDQITYRFSSSELGINSRLASLDEAIAFAKKLGFSPRNVAEGWTVKHLRFSNGIELCDETGYHGAWIFQN